MAYIKHKELTVNREKTPSRTKHHKDPNKCRKTSDLSLAKYEKVCTMVPKVSPKLGSGAVSAQIYLRLK